MGLHFIKNGTKHDVCVKRPPLFPASATTYDNSQSGLSATRVQGAIDELAKPTFTEASARANIASGESFSTILGKIKKFFTDLKTVAFTGSYYDLSNKFFQSNTLFAIKGDNSTRSVADGSYVETDAVTVSKTGMYLFIFYVSHCGANNLTKAGAFWDVYMMVNGTNRNPAGTGKTRIAIPVAATWDVAGGQGMALYDMHQGDSIVARFENKTGVSTDATYSSAFSYYGTFLY